MKRATRNIPNLWQKWHQQWWRNNSQLVCNKSKPDGEEWGVRKKVMKKSIRRTDHRMSAKNTEEKKNYMQTVLVKRHSNSSFFSVCFFHFIRSFVLQWVNWPFFSPHSLCSIGNISASQACIVLICVLKTIVNNRITCLTQKCRHQCRNELRSFGRFSFQWLANMCVSDDFCSGFVLSFMCVCVKKNQQRIKNITWSIFHRLGNSLNF